MSSDPWLLRALVRCALRLCFRLRVEGTHRVPVRGGVLLAANHLSLLDGIILWAFAPRPSRFLVWARWVQAPVIGWLLRRGGAIAIDETAGHRALAGAMTAATDCARAGQAVGIFPEGKLSRSGQLDRFQAGCERITSRAGVPVVPVGLHGLWDIPIVSHSPRPWWGWRWRPVVRMRFGDPLPASTTAPALRQAVDRIVHDLGMAAVAADRRTLGSAAVAGLRANAFRLAVMDAGGRLTGLLAAGLADALRVRLRLAADEDALGIVLPPGRGGMLANVACAWAGRTAVNLNHTAGAAQLAAMCRKAGLRTVVTSRIYRQKIKLPELPVRLIDLEEILPGIPRIEILARGLARLLTPAPAADPDAVACLVFTSGSTGEPKGVELTHRQVLAQCDGIASAFRARSDDRACSPLPLFHSFGLVPGLWFPLASGLPLAAQPDPNDGAGLAKLMETLRPTLLMGTPTFARGWMRRIEPAQAAALRMTILGAERCPGELRTAWRERYGSPLLEGYGCTELAPVATVNLPAFTKGRVTEERSRDGSVGRPLPGVHIAAVDPESGRVLPPGEEGLLVVWSPSRMRGYRDRDDLTAAALCDGGYRTGDRGRVDADGFVTITGRLSRFAKIGGEMVPLDLVQEAVQGALITAGATCESAVTAVPDPTKGEKLVVLHTGWDGDWESLLAGLSLAPLWKPRAKDAKRVDAIPRLGTGKMDLAGIAALAR